MNIDCLLYRLRASSKVIERFLNFRVSLLYNSKSTKIIKYYKTHPLPPQGFDDITETLDNFVRISSCNKQRTLLDRAHTCLCDIPNERRVLYDRSLDVAYDKEKKLRYVDVDGKRMYFKRCMNQAQIVDYFNIISFEQDYYSPHRYFSRHMDFIGVPASENNDFDEEWFGVKQGDVVVDLGGAEGNFALSIVDIVKKLYIFECDDEWVKALQATFEPYKHKVEIIRKHVSDKITDTHITLDSFFDSKNEKVNFIKLDIEGFEEAALKGAKSTMTNSDDTRVALCLYHRPQDKELFSEMLQEMGYRISFAKGHFVCILSKEHWIRKAVLRAVLR